eukprot:TRINITY_DN64588_c0_g1_i1.p1 TRINITY_DN64588_c0_g1~~TRINITY_DN64588_c0_g1_i1.p1  ORF type:complete len:480 (+),score=61.21 TRINITY_DN64588_c0_g1_i1:57-1496(+)
MSEVECDHLDTQHEQGCASRNFCEGVLWRNVLAFGVVSACTIMLLVYMNAAQAFALTQFYGIQPGELGKTSGILTLVDEVWSIILLGAFGILTDRFGSALITAFGFAFMSLSLGLIPFGSNLASMAALRLVFATGGAMTTPQLTSLVAEYFRKESQGRATGWQGLLAGLGAIVAVFGLVRLPAHLCLRFAYWLAAGISAIAAILAGFGLRWRSPREKEASLCKLVSYGYHYVCKDKQMLLVFASGFMARAGATVVSVYVSLWVNEHYLRHELCGQMRSGDLAQTLCGEELVPSTEKSACRNGFTRASIISGVLQTSALVFAPIAGHISERFSPMKATAASAALGAVSYLSWSLLSSPEGIAPVLIAMLVGTGEISMVISSTRLTASMSPPELRGIVAGCFSLFGGAGVLFAGVVGGLLFDTIGGAAPFGVIGLLDLALCFCFIMKLSCRRQATRMNETESDGLPEDEMAKGSLPEGGKA